VTRDGARLGQSVAKEPGDVGGEKIARGGWVRWKAWSVKVHDAKNNEAHGAMNKERHVCARRRGGEPAVSWTACARARAGERPVSWTVCGRRRVV